MITSIDWDDKKCVLRNNKSGEAVLENQVIIREGEETYIVTGGRAPHKPSSTGRIWVKSQSGMSREFFPSVLDLEWVEC